jgi:outer membrane beta-barrel protein
MMLRALLATGMALLASRAAFAQSDDDIPPPSADKPAVSSPLDIGVLKNQDITVVQKLLFPKTGRLELGAHLGWMPFDTYTTTPVFQLTGMWSKSEQLGFEGSFTGGYGLKNANYKILESDAYGITPDAYRFLGSFLVDAQWSPIYAKMSLAGKKIAHYDIYGLGGLGVSAEQAILPDNAMAFSPTLGLGVGMRFFVHDTGTIRVQVRDDLLREKRVKTADSQGFFLKQNAAITIGYSKLGKRKS